MSVLSLNTITDQCLCWLVFDLGMQDIGFRRYSVLGVRDTQIPNTSDSTRFNKAQKILRPAGRQPHYHYGISDFNVRTRLKSLGVVHLDLMHSCSQSQPTARCEKSQSGRFARRLCQQIRAFASPPTCITSPLSGCLHRAFGMGLDSRSCPCRRLATGFGQPSRDVVSWSGLQTQKYKY